MVLTRSQTQSNVNSNVNTKVKVNSVKEEKSQSSPELIEFCKDSHQLYRVYVGFYERCGVISNSGWHPKLSLDKINYKFLHAYVMSHKGMFEFHQDFQDLIKRNLYVRYYVYHNKKAKHLFKIFFGYRPSRDEFMTYIYEKPLF
jgi:hypothetical protein